MEFTREMLQQAYEDATGLDARRGHARIDTLENWIREHNLENFRIINDPHKMASEYWYAGKQDGNTICLGYTSGRGSFVYKNAIFAQSDEIFVGE
jgi:hypothetical protein